jgi:hypothetical protein
MAITHYQTITSTKLTGCIMKIKTPILKFLIGLGSMCIAHSALAQTKTELAGNALTSYPFFEYVKAINFNDNVQIAIDPSRFSSIAGQTCDIYVVANRTTLEWNANNVLTDVTTGGFQTVTFSNTNIQANTFEVVAANELSAVAGLGLGVGYDVIVDVNRDGHLTSTDYIDGRNNEAGFYRVHDTTLPGPEAVTELTYNIDATTATTFGIPPTRVAENLFFPTNVAGVRTTTGAKLPLIIVSHGNGHDYSWYDHIGNHLASYGYVVMSHQNNTGPGPVSASTTTVGHTGALIDRIENSAIPGAEALAGNIDVNRIVWIGHSRGGEGVALAYDRMFDGEVTTTNYTMADIKLISSMLPTDFQGTTPLAGNAPSASIADPHTANYHLWTASGDSDVNGGAGSPRVQTFHIHDRAAGNRQSTVVQGTGHAWFHNGHTTNTWFTGPCSIGETNTQLILLGHLIPLVKRYVEDNIPSLDFLTRQYESFRPIGVPNDACIVVSHEYYDASPNTPANLQKTIVIDDYQTQTATTTSSIGSTVSFTVTNITEDRLDDNNSDFFWNTTDPFNGATQASATDASRGVVFDWTDSDLYYEWVIPVGERNFSDNLYLSFRGAQGTQHPNTLAGTAGADLTFSIRLTDGSATPVSSTINIGAYGGGFEEPYQRNGGWHNEMETIRIRLTDFLNNATGTPLDLTNIVSVRVFGGPSFGSAKGRIVIDDLVLSNDRAVYDARDNGDPHITTVDGTYYDFHGAGEYTLLRDGEGYEIQVRQTPVTTANPLANSYTGLSSCVAVNTALAARVGNHRISYQPDGPVNEQETRMRLRVDGVIQDINTLGTISLGTNARVTKTSAGNGIQIDFPNESSLIVVPGWWSAHNIAWLNITVQNTPATEGIAGLIEPGQWLPALSDGTHLGSKPANLTDRYKQLNQIFSKSWRVNNSTSLFDYAAGTSTATFTVPGWPFENATSCEIPQMSKVTALNKDVAVKACAGIIDRNNRNNCVMDVMVTGETGFAKTYLLAQKLELAGTKTEIHPERKAIKTGNVSKFVAVIKRAQTDQRLTSDEKEKRRGVGIVQFYFNGKPTGKPVPVDRFGRAQWTSPKLSAGEHKVSAEFIPVKDDPTNLSSRSPEVVYVVR